VAPALVKDFQSAPPTLRALDEDKSPLVWRADAPKNGWPAAPFRAVLDTQSAITALNRWNCRDTDHTPVHGARVRFDCVPAGQDQGKPPVAGLDRPAGARVRPARLLVEDEPGAVAATVEAGHQ